MRAAIFTQLHTHLCHLQALYRETFAELAFALRDEVRETLELGRSFLSPGDSLLAHGFRLPCQRLRMLNDVCNALCTSPCLRTIGCFFACFNLFLA